MASAHQFPRTYCLIGKYLLFVDRAGNEMFAFRALMQLSCQFSITSRSFFFSCECRSLSEGSIRSQMHDVMYFIFLDLPRIHIEQAQNTHLDTLSLRNSHLHVTFTHLQKKRQKQTPGTCRSKVLNEAKGSLAWEPSFLLVYDINVVRWDVFRDVGGEGSDSRVMEHHRTFVWNHSYGFIWSLVLWDRSRTLKMVKLDLFIYLINLH